jgi:hypothetical protein
METGFLISDLYEHWQTNSWVDYTRNSYTYDVIGNKLTDLYEFWENNAWLILFRDTNTYNTDGNLVTFMRESWQSGIWSNDYKNSFTYDENGNSLTGKYEVWQDGSWNPGKGNLDLYSDQEIIYRIYNYHRYVAKFASLYTSISENQNDNCNLVIYPNPFSEKITIITQNSNLSQKNTLTIYSSSGYLVLYRQITDPLTHIDLSAFSSGIYFFRLSNRESVQIKKVIKE